MKTFLTVIGARPQFIKAAALSRELKRQQMQEIVVHTGQHYDHGMSQIFFEELEMEPPDVNLGVGSGSHGKQTGEMLAGLEQVMVDRQPDAVIVYGDTNSTLAGALAASKLHLPVVHIEAGLRSFNRRMPEEINRIVTDHLSQLLFCSSEESATLLAKEGIHQGVHMVGDIMADTFLWARQKVANRKEEGLKLPDGFALATLHRAENTDDENRLAAILNTLAEAPFPVLLPLHPRTRSRLGPERLRCFSGTSLQFIEPVGYLEMVRLLSCCRLVVTDSGGLQKEAYWADKACVTVRPETEWVETVEAGWNRLVDANPADIREALNSQWWPTDHPELYGDGQAARRIVAALAAV